MLHMVMKMKTGMPQHKHSRFYYKMIRTNSHTAAIPKRIMEKAAESPNSNTPTASEMINPQHAEYSAHYLSAHHQQDTNKFKHTDQK